MQRYTIFFSAVNALRVSGSFSAHHQELKNCTHSIWYMSGLLAATASMGELAVKHVEHWQHERILYNAASCWLYLEE
jgi:hypothetical protein